MRQPASLAAGLVHDSSGRLFAVFWGSLVVVDLTTVLHLPTAVGTSGVVLVVAVASLRQTATTLMAAAAMGWLFVNAFLVNHLGQLGWTGLPDLWRLLLLLGAAGTAALLSDLDGFLTRARGRRDSARVPSHDAPGHPGASVEVGRHAVGR